MLARLRPWLSSTRRSSSVSSSARSCSASHACRPGTSSIPNSAAISARVGARTDLTRLEAIAKQQRQRIEQDGLAGSGLAGEHREAGVAFDAEVLDDGEIADGQQAQHAETRWSVRLDSRDDSSERRLRFKRSRQLPRVGRGSRTKSLGRFAPVQLLAQHREVVVALADAAAALMRGAARRSRVSPSSSVWCDCPSQCRLASLAAQHRDHRSDGVARRRSAGWSARAARPAPATSRAPRMTIGPLADSA